MNSKNKYKIGECESNHRKGSRERSRERERERERKSFEKKFRIFLQEKR